MLCHVVISRLKPTIKRRIKLQTETFLEAEPVFLTEKMLTIKRVPTVLSNYQEQAPQTGEELGCGRSCLGKCCVPASRLPLYAVKKETEESTGKGESTLAEEQISVSFLQNILLGQWEDRMRRGLFRYDVTACETKVIDGVYGFIAQLNEGRHLKKRPTEFRVDQVLQPFDQNKFNFTKIGQEEVLFRFEHSVDNQSHYFPTAPVTADDDDDDDSTSPNVVAINVSPIEYGHVLLIPRVLNCLPQRIDHESFLLALHMAKEAVDPFFRVGYNSLGAFATINHLHFQAYYLPRPFPVEKATTSTVVTTSIHGQQENQITVSRLLGYPVRGLVFEGGISSLRDLCDVVVRCCIFLQNNNIPFNILISDSGKRIFLFPQCYAEKQALGEVSKEVLETQVNPAVWEISGHIVLKRRKDFDEASEEYALKLLSEVSLSEERFQEVKSYVLEAAGLKEADREESNETEEEGKLGEEKEQSRRMIDSAASNLLDSCVVQH